MGRAALNRKRRAILAFGAFAVSLANSVSGAVETPSRVTLHVEGGGDCPLHAKITSRLAEILSDVAGGTPVTATLVAQRSATGTAGMLVTETETHRGERHFEPLPCDELAQAAALVIALAVEPLAALPTGDGTAPPEATAAPATVPESPSPTRNTEERPPSSPKEPGATLEAQLRAAVRNEAALGWTPGVDLALGVGTGRWQFLLNAQWWSPRRSPAFPVEGGSLTIARTEVGARSCYLWDLSGLSLGPCASVRAVAWSARTRGISDPKATIQWRLRGEGELHAEWGLPHLRLIAGAHAGVGGPERFISSTLGELHRAKPLEFWPSLGVAASF